MLHLPCFGGAFLCANFKADFDHRTDRRDHSYKGGGRTEDRATPNGRAAGKDQRRYHRSLGSRWRLCQASGPRPYQSYHAAPRLNVPQRRLAILGPTLALRGEADDDAKIAWIVGLLGFFRRCVRRDRRRKLTSRPGALPEPCVNLSIHTAPDVRPLPWHSGQ